MLIDKKIFEQQTILSVIEKLASKIEIHDLKDNESSFELRFTPKEGNNIESLISEINLKLVEQKMKDIVFKETKDIRTLILANAFSKTSLIDY